MSSAKDIADQCKRLMIHRQNVQLTLRQISAQGGWMYAPISLLNNLSENRKDIARCKAILQGWHTLVEDHPDDDAVDNIDALDQQIAELEASRRTLPALVRQAVEQALAGVQERRASLGKIEAAISISGQTTVRGAVLGVNQGTVQVFFGGQPPEDGAILLDAYLDSLSRECEHLRLSRLTGKRQTGAERRADPPLRLQAVYTSLTTDGKPILVERQHATVEQALKALDEQRTPEDVPPEEVRLVEVSSDISLPLQRLGRWLLKEMAPDESCALWISRLEFVLEAIALHQRLVLLGEPGAGKSTVLRYIALLLAQRLRGNGNMLSGWPIKDLPIPILCPLGRVAAKLSEHKVDAELALYQVLGDLLEGEQGQCAGLSNHLRSALRGDGVLLLFDGLDELPTEDPLGGISPRAAVADALRKFAGRTRSRIVVTSRVLAYRAKGDWQLPTDEDWQIRTITPLAFGQVRTFVNSWYAALASSGGEAELPKEIAQDRARLLVEELALSSNLRQLIASPLLLTMLAILHYNTDEVPHDQARLYEECVQLLLERWEAVRTPGLRRPSLLERLGNVPRQEFDLLRGAIHELAFQAHDCPPSEDGRGMIDGDLLRGRMLRLFESMRNPNPARALAIFVQVLREDAGLLLERADGQYAFPHLTFQEYLAACHLADLRDMAEKVHGRWHGPDAERWRVVLRLLVGRLRQQGKLDDKLIPWLQHLIAPRRGIDPKPALERHRDTALAMLVYEELGAAALVGSASDVQDLIDKLRTALLDLLAEYDSMISTTDRVRAGFLLGELGDTRVPTTIEQWRDALAKAQSGEVGGYFCRVEAGTYWIGSIDDDQEARSIEKPQHQATFYSPFWVGRYPITNAQWQMWVKVGGRQSLYVDDTDLNHPNQPVVGIMWQEAEEFCKWLGMQLGLVVRLARGREWEAAARGGADLMYPWGNSWMDDCAATVENLETRSRIGSAPVGCYPAGRSICGAFDMLGNVWEWTRDACLPYAHIKKPYRRILKSRYVRSSLESGDNHTKHTFQLRLIPFFKNRGYMLRGGSFSERKNLARCAARVKFRSSKSLRDIGFRIVFTF